MWNGTQWVTFAQVTGMLGNEILPIQISSELLTSRIRFDLGSTGSTSTYSQPTNGWRGIREAIFLAIPEPGAAGVMMCVGAMCAARRSRRHGQSR